MHAILTRSILPSIIACGLVAGEARLPAQPLASPPAGIDNYDAGPDSKPQPGVLKGQTFSFKFEDSQIDTLFVTGGGKH
jgi:hypothetical protein